MTDDDGEPVVVLSSGRTLNQRELENWLRVKGCPEHDRLVIIDYVKMQDEIGLTPVPLGDLPSSISFTRASDMLGDSE